MVSRQLPHPFAEGRLYVCYQPIVRMADRQLMAFEALSRLDDPTLGLLQPAEFVAEIEQAGDADVLTDLVVARVFRDIRLQAGTADGPPCDISLNVPLDVVLTPGYLDRMDALRVSLGITAERIVVELTESQPVDDLLGLALALDRLGAAGYRAVIDDFAPEMANHAALLDLPFVAVKFDHTLVKASECAGAEADFIAWTVTAAHARGLTVTAEGIDSAQAWDRLADIGVDAAQGFWIAAPMGPDEIVAWTEAWKGRQSGSHTALA